MGRRRYRIRISGKPRPHPDPAMLAQIVILIGRRLQEQQRHRSAVTRCRNGRPEDDDANRDPFTESEP